MRRMKIMLVLLFVFAISKAPYYTTLLIPESEKIQPFDPMLYAFQKVESNFDETVINSLGYGGMLQIGQEMVDEVNRINQMRGSPIRFILDDRLDSLKSVQMWYTAQSHWNPTYGLKQACYLWNSLASKQYYEKINLERLSIILKICKM